MSRTPEQLAQLLASYAVSPDEQVRQVAHRCALVDLWKIRDGSDVLEVGCGQGDMTVVLGNRVGDEGRVVALDSAPPDYGAPISLGDSVKALRDGPLGDRLDIRLGFSDWETVPNDFDCAVLAHCAWYFPKISELYQTLEELRSRAIKLHFAEWRLQPKTKAQTAHFLAAIMQTLASANQPNTTRNIRNAYSEKELIAVIEAAGWKIEQVDVIAQPQLDDGVWEVAAALEVLKETFPDDVRAELENIAGQLAAQEKPYEALPCLVITAV
ncbi:MAG: hypothetical protein JNK63_08835 [Chthonomonas sp.]|nr:hypothetical protein [Chthonomonas sp.]